MFASLIAYFIFLVKLCSCALQLFIISYPIRQTVPSLGLVSYTSRTLSSLFFLFSSVSCWAFGSYCSLAIAIPSIDGKKTRSPCIYFDCILGRRNAKLSVNSNEIRVVNQNVPIFIQDGNFDVMMRQNQPMPKISILGVCRCVVRLARVKAFQTSERRLSVGTFILLVCYMS